MPFRLFRILLPARVRCDDQYRTFTDTQARTFSGIGTIRWADGETGTMPLDAFCEADRQYIRTWSMANDFMKAIRISAQLQDADPSEKESEHADPDRLIKNYYYLVQIENPSASAFEKLRMENCIFYRQGERKGSRTEYDECTYYGRSEIRSLAPASTHPVETRRVSFSPDNGVRTMFGKTGGRYTGDIHGIWLRLTLRMPGGSMLVREYRSSDDENWKWTPYSIEPGVKKGIDGVRHILE